MHECPCCGAIRTLPMPSTKTTSWTDDCACDDRHTCPYHQLNPEEHPLRPSDEVMLVRAYERADRHLPKYNKLIERFTKVKEFLDATEPNI